MIQIEICFEYVKACLKMPLEARTMAMSVYTIMLFKYLSSFTQRYLGVYVFDNKRV